MRKGTARKGTVWKAVLVLFALGVAAFAVDGGEYGTLDLLRQRARRADLQRAVDSLRVEVDSLVARRDAIRRDPRVQERIAREEFGMVRDGELLYRFVEERP